MEITNQNLDHPEQVIYVNDYFSLVKMIFIP